MNRAGVLLGDDDGGGFGGSPAKLFVFFAIWAVSVAGLRMVISLATKWSDEAAWNAAVVGGGLLAVLLMT